MRWLWIILALAYLLSPYDLIPGIQGAGWIDDIIVLGLLYRYLSKTKRVGTGRKSPGDEQQEAASEGSDSAVPNGIRPKSPHEILGLTPTASQDEIKAAYRKLAGQYHPDKVSHLGKEFQTLAENRFTEIQEAYEKLLLP